MREILYRSLPNEPSFGPLLQNIFFNILNLWARKQLAYKYDGNKILFVIIFFNAITFKKEEGNNHFLDILNYLNNETLALTKNLRPSTLNFLFFG